MVDALVTIRNAKPNDADAISAVHDDSWREAYRGIIPGAELERIISKRGSQWWRRAIARGSNIQVLDTRSKLAGYVTFGRNRVPALRHKAELFEIYLLPEFQGLGYGRRLFRSAQLELARHGYASMIVWALADNQRAIDFYLNLGGRQLRVGNETFGDTVCQRIAFDFDTD